MTLRLEPEHLIVYEDDDLLAVRQRGQVEVWAGYGETHLGNLPPSATSADIECAVMFYNRGHDEGMKGGADGARRVIRQALGLA